MRYYVLAVCAGAISLSACGRGSPEPTMTPLSHSDGLAVARAQLRLLEGTGDTYGAADKLVEITRRDPCAVYEGIDGALTMREVLRENAGYDALPAFEVDNVLAELEECPNPRNDRSWEDVEPGL